MQAGFEAMSPVIDQLAVKYKLNTAGKEELKGVFCAWYDEDLDRSKIISEIKELYYQSFTDDEIRKITEFYQTPTGKKLLEESGQLMKLSVQISMKESQSKQGKLRERLKPSAEKYGIK